MLESISGSENEISLSMIDPLSGTKVSQAEFYLAECFRNIGQMEKACDYYAKAADDGTGSFRELAILNYARISYDLQRYEDALGGYASLLDSARLENNRYEAMLGMMRSAYMAHRYDDAIKYASDVRSDRRSNGDTVRESDWITAKSYLATSRRDEAFAILDTLSADPYSSEGAEAAWLLIQDCYDRGVFDEVETRVYSLSDTGTGQTYWLAKSFIVLGDAFAERGELEQAKATFQSIADGYTPLPGGDDVLDNVRMRLSRIEEMMSSTETETGQEPAADSIGTL